MFWSFLINRPRTNVPTKLQRHFFYICRSKIYDLKCHPFWNTLLDRCLKSLHNPVKHMKFSLPLLGKKNYTTCVKFCTSCVTLVRKHENQTRDKIVKRCNRQNLDYNSFTVAGLDTENTARIHRAISMQVFPWCTGRGVWYRPMPMHVWPGPGFLLPKWVCAAETGSKISLLV